MLLADGASSVRRTPSWLATLKVLDGPAAGAYAELRLWPASRSASLLDRIASIADVEPAEVAGWDGPARRDAVAGSLASRSLQVVVRTAADGTLEATSVRGTAGRVDPAPVPEAPLPRPTAPAPAATGAAFDEATVAVRHVASGDELAAAVAWLGDARVLGVDIETDCGPLGSPRRWDASDGAVRLVQVAARRGSELRCVIADCYGAVPTALLRLLADPTRIVVAHNAAYEARWLAFHFGLPAFARPFDTACAARILERHWHLSDPGYAPRDARLETVIDRYLGLVKAPLGQSWWGAEPLAAPQLAYAALDAAALPALHEALVTAARAAGLLDVVVAASSTGVDAATRRLPLPRGRVAEEAARLLDEAPDDAGLARAAGVLRRLSLGVAARHHLGEAWRRRRDALAAA